jgi:hypothetical protein
MIKQALSTLVAEHIGLLDEFFMILGRLIS